MDKTYDSLIAEYIRTIEKELVAGNATEHTHRPALNETIRLMKETDRLISAWHIE